MKPDTLLLIASSLFIAQGAALAQYTPTDFEQYQLELINRARLNPGGEVTRLAANVWGNTGAPATPDLNEGLAAGTITNTPKQALAFNPALIKSARDYSALLLANNAFTHTFGGTTPTQRMTTAGYTFNGAFGSGENLQWSGSTLAFPITTAVSEDHHNQLFIDRNVAGRGHRLNILDGAMKEIGLGIAAGNNYNGGAGGQVFNSVVTTQNYAHSTGNAFFTGVVFRDTDANNFYTPGEGVGGATVTATPAVGAPLTTTTWTSGGYSLQVPPGDYTVTASGPFTTVQMTPIGPLTINATNEKLDARVLDTLTTAAQIINPAQGATLPSTSVKFDWDTGTNVTSYALWIGSTLGGSDLYAGAEGANLTRTVTLPGDGRAIHVTLHSLINGVYQNNKYSYTAFTSPTPEKAKMIDPVNGTAMLGTTLNLLWDDGVGATQYYIFMGTTPGGYDLYAGSQGTNNGVNLTVPASNGRIYVTLYSLINGAWQGNHYYYVTPAGIPAELTGLVDGDVLPGAATTLNWSTGLGATSYAVWVSSQPDGYDIAAWSGTAATTNVTMPTDGRHVYVTLWSLINGKYEKNEYWFKTATLDATQPAAIINQVNGTTLTSTSATFLWDSGVGASQYALWVGTTPGGYNLYSSLETGNNRSRTVNNLPTNGAEIYVTLYTMIGGVWKPTHWFFTTHTGVASEIATPANAAVLADENLTLTWPASVGVTKYYLWVGRQSGGYDLHAGDEGLNLVKNVIVPTDGTLVYVTLWSLIDGAFQSSSRAYTTANTGAGNKRALITSHANLDLLNAAITTFDWSTGTGVTSYALWIGSTPGAYDLHASLEGTNRTRQVTLPTDGRTIYLTVWSLISGGYQGSHYIFFAHNSAQTKAVLTAPNPAFLFGSATENFTWSAGAGATQYALWIGSTPGGYDIYGGAEGTNLAKTVTTLPSDGRPVYVKLWSFLSGAWQGNEYIFNAWQKP